LCRAREELCEKEKGRGIGGLGKLRGAGSGEIGLNHFSKINKEFSVKWKIFYVDYYFSQTPINVKNIFCKLFYDETNRA
jgi:hypothetical protein